MLYGYSQNALSFDGVNDYVDAGNASSVQLTGTAITIEAWIYPTAWRTNIWEGNIINKEDDSNNSGYMLRCGNNGRLNFNLGSGSWNELTSAPSVLTLNTWQHVAGTYDGSKMRIYVNGVPVDSLSRTLTISNTGSSQNLMVGNWSYTSAERGFIGMIDDARLWNIHRTKSEIEANMNHEYCSTNSGLIAYLKFNEGVASSSNSGVNTAIDFTANANDGTLHNFSLSGSVSNWVTGILPNISSIIDVVSLCNATTYTWSDGVTYTSNNSTASQAFQTSYGCDSIITLNLTFNNSNTGVDVQNACIGSTFTWIDGLDYTADNSTATHTLTNIAGCDSVVTLNLAFTNNSNTGVDVQSACMGSTFTWIDGLNYTMNNSTATHTLTNMVGCDSVVTLNLTFLNNTTGVDVLAACDTYTWIDGVTYTESNNTATHTLVNANGCDSVVTLNLTINTVDNSVVRTGLVISSNQAGASYQWLSCGNNYSEVIGAVDQSFTVTINGQYAVEVTNNNCIDTSSCVTVLNVGIKESSLGTVMNFYPNPTKGIVTINFESMISEGSFIVEDVRGKQVIPKKEFSSDLLTIDLRGLTSGIYFVTINNGKGREVIKLIKE